MLLYNSLQVYTWFVSSNPVKVYSYVAGHGTDGKQPSISNYFDNSFPVTATKLRSLSQVVQQ